MSEAYNNILKFSLEQKSLKIPFIIYTDTESLLEKISTCDSNPKESYKTIISKHACSVWSFTIHALFI